METVEEPSGVPRSRGVLSVSRAALGVEEPQGSHGGVVEGTDGVADGVREADEAVAPWGRWGRRRGEG